MIRREIQLAHEKPCWLLISQVEHARISSYLAEQCIEKFGRSAGDRDLNQVREELLAAIVHHDDGWAEWEARPGLDEDGKPLSFRELPLAESISIWTESIKSAANIGDLAGHVVAEHFLALLKTTEKTREEVAESWQRETEHQSSRWLARWQKADPKTHVEELAVEALAWLQLFDVMSLWLAGVCPGGGEHVTNWPDSYYYENSTKLASEFSCASQPGNPSYPANAEYCRGTLNPWPYDVAEIEVEAKGWIVPRRRYADSTDLQKSMLPHEVRWLLTSPT